MRLLSWWIGIVCIATLCANGSAEDVKPLKSAPAKTRPEMKRQIEAIKEREARLPLPERASSEMQDRYMPNSNRLKALYLPESWQSSRPNSGGQGQGQFTNGQGQGQFNGGQRGPGQGQSNNGQGQGQSNGGQRQFSGQGQGQGQFNGPGRGSNQGPDMNAPEYPFKKRMFWVVSRTNDCRYCMGHQEQGLQRIGMTDNQIAALDCDWSGLSADEQAGMRFARKLTLTPHLVTKEDIQSLRKHFTDQQVMDIVQAIGSYNSMNRWTEATGIPQDNSRELLDTPTSDEFSSIESKVAPFDRQPRPAWESRAKAEAAMAASLERTAEMRLPGQREAIARDGRLNPKLKVLISWVCARENRAWYSAAQARKKLNELGVSDDVLFAIGGNEESFTPSERATFAFARKLTASPQIIDDADVVGLRVLFSDYEVAEIIFLVCEANSYDRITEVTRLMQEGSEKPKTVGQVPSSKPSVVEVADRDTPRNAYSRPAPVLVEEREVPRNAYSRPASTTDSALVVDNASHEQVTKIKVGGGEKSRLLHTFCLSADGKLIAAVQSSGALSGAQKAESDKPNGELLWFDGEGQLLKALPLDIIPTAVNVAPDGHIFVAGSCTLLKLDSTGKILMSVDSPNKKALEENALAIRSELSPALVAQSESTQQNLVTMQARVKELEAKEQTAKTDGKELSRAEKVRLTAARQSVKSLQEELAKLTNGRTGSENGNRSQGPQGFVSRKERMQQSLAKMQARVTELQTLEDAAKSEGKELNRDDKLRLTAARLNIKTLEAMISSIADEQPGQNRGNNEWQPPKFVSRKERAQESLVKMQTRVKELEAKAEGKELSRDDQVRLTAARLNIKGFEAMVASLPDETSQAQGNGPVPSYLEWGSEQQLKVVEHSEEGKKHISAIAVTDSDVFMACIAPGGHNHEIWRLDHELQNPVKIVQKLRGCCGQMDMQARSGDLCVAENSMHRVCRYDREGKLVKTWGEREGSAGIGFGGCCNPMNLRFGPNGDIYTSESSLGRIRRFSPDGEYLGLVGQAKLISGCKHVAVGIAADSKRVYLMDVTRGEIILFDQKDAGGKTTAAK